MKRNIAELQAVVQILRVIGDDGGRLHRQFADAPAIDADRQGNDRSATPAASPAAALSGRASAIPSAIRAPTLGKALAQRLERGRVRRRFEHHAHEETSGLDVVNCCASRMFWPLSNRNAETAATIPGRSGQDRVRTSGRPDMAMRTLSRWRRRIRFRSLARGQRPALSTAIPHPDGPFARTAYRRSGSHGQSIQFCQCAI